MKVVKCFIELKPGQVDKDSLLMKSEYVRISEWYGSADWNGSNNYLYLAYLTRYRVNSSTRLRGKHRIINGSPGDFSVLSRDVVGHFGGKVVVIPTVRGFYID